MIDRFLPLTGKVFDPSPLSFIWFRGKELTVSFFNLPNIEKVTAREKVCHWSKKVIIGLRKVQSVGLIKQELHPMNSSNVSIFLLLMCTVDLTTWSWSSYLVLLLKMKKKNFCAPKLIVAVVFDKKIVKVYVQIFYRGNIVLFNFSQTNKHFIFSVLYFFAQHY